MNILQLHENKMNELKQDEETYKNDIKKLKAIQKEKKRYLLNNIDLVFDYYDSIEQANLQRLNGFFNIEPKHDIHKSTKKYLLNEHQLFDLEPDKTKCNCNGEYVVDDGVMVCNICFKMNGVECNETNVIPNEINSCYKKLNHFREILKQVQGKERFHLSDETIVIIQNYIKKHRLNIETLSVSNLKSILKILDMKHLYDHINLVFIKLGKKVDIVSYEIEDKLITMFNMAQNIYYKHAPVHKSNFLNYQYCLYKLLQILNIKIEIQMIKGKTKLLESDTIWRKICDELGWRFIPTI